jgi:hypothetical protein
LVTNTNQVALKAIQKELDIEQLLKKEELEKEARAEKEVQIAMEQEKRKGDYLLQAIKEKKMENQLNTQAKQIEDEVKSIKQAASQEINTKRNTFKDFIAKLKRESQNRINQVKQQMLTVKYQIAKTVTKASKKGDKNQCLNVMKNPSDIKLYCIANYDPNDINFTTCNNQEDFCRMCCQAEYGEFYDTDRLDCIEQICNNPANHIATGTNNSGQGAWVWTKPS